MNAPFTFPVFRSYTDGLTWFKVESPTQFTELKIMGKHFSLNPIIAEKHPERMFVQDLLNCEFESIKRASEDQYLRMLKHCEAELTRVEF
jgi:hypothetical protein